MAPPLDFGLAGLPDWPGIRVRDRLSGLRRHPLSMSSAPNRRLARLALHGDRGRRASTPTWPRRSAGFARRPAAPCGEQLGAGAIGAEPGWLEVVLSWPDRIEPARLDWSLPVPATG